MDTIELGFIHIREKEKRVPKYIYFGIYQSEFVFEKNFKHYSSDIPELGQIEQNITEKYERYPQSRELFDQIEFETLATMGEIHKIGPITFDPEGSPFLIYLLKHEPDSKSLGFIPIVKLKPQFKLLVFQVNRIGEMKLLTSPSNGSNFFTEKDLQMKYILDDTLIFETNVTKGELSENVSIYHNNLHTFNRKEIVDNNFIQNILNLSFSGITDLSGKSRDRNLPSDFPLSGDYSKDVQFLLKMDPSQLQQAAENNSYIRNIVDNKDFILNYLRAHSYPEYILLDKSDEISYSEFLIHLVNLDDYKIVTKFNDQFYKINTGVLGIMLDEGKSNILKYLLNNIDVNIRRFVVYDASDMELLYTHQLIELVDFFIKNFRYNEPDLTNILYTALIEQRESYVSNVPRDEKLDFEIFKLISDNFQLNSEDLLIVLRSIVKYGKIQMFDYFIRKYNIAPSREHLATAQKNNQYEFVNHLRSVYNIM